MIIFDHVGLYKHIIPLLEWSPYHSSLSNQERYYETQIRPFLEKGLFGMWFDDINEAFAVFTYAYISQSVLNDMCNIENRALQPDELNGGDILFFNDFIAKKNGAVISRWLHRDAFPEKVGYMIRRNMGGSIKRVVRTKGKNVKSFEPSR